MAVQHLSLQIADEKQRERLTPPAPSAIAVEDPNIFDLEEYKALVAELEVDDSAIRNYEFRQLLAAEGIPVYDYTKVASFMDAKAEEEGKKHKIAHLTWQWKPLNEKYPDIPKSSSADPISFEMLRGIMSGRVRFGGRSLSAFDEIDGLISERGTATTVRPSRVYNRPIPHAVLLTIKKLKDRFKDAVHFYATDYEVKDPDPFLLVTGPGLEYYVIERWDEPKFRG